jgi:hypothetical protein
VKVRVKEKVGKIRGKEGGYEGEKEGYFCTINI